ncbi:MAG TPA: class I SAM-dependent methyltransferase [Amycolatopsis sp.]|nr:class I SAM-dependent methyltransferase [Amycolatopsis sp.]
MGGTEQDRSQVGHTHGHGHGHGHTHDNIDWAERIPNLRQVDALHRATFAEIARRLTNDLPAEATVVDAGCGAGGMSAALAAALRHRGGGRLVLVDAVPELLTVAGEVARGGAATAAGGGPVEVDVVQADVAEDDLPSVVPAAQLVWAAHMVHHLPDQQAGIAGLAGVLAPGGVLAIAEGGLETECLPWDLGIDKPGFERRLLAARESWFIDMRAAIAGSARMPYGWTVALRRAGLADVGSFTSVVDHPAPPTDAVRDFAVGRIGMLVETVGEHLGEEDRQAAHHLLDPTDERYLGRRDDLFVLGTRTVHYGRRP